MSSSLLSPTLGIGFVLIVFWYLSRRKRKEEAKKGNKNDLWYLVKEYLKVTSRQGYKIADLTFYSRANTISLFREHVLENRELLEKRREKILGEKRDRSLSFKRKLLKKFPISNNPLFPREEKYQKKIELYTLKIIAKKYSIFQAYLQEYERFKNNEEFKKLLNTRLIGESLSKVTKNKNLNARNRYLVCFKTMNKNNVISDWEAIEIELFKNPKAQSKEKFKVMFTASLDYKKELHWIYAQQYKYERGKIERIKSIENQLKNEKRKKERLSKLQPFLHFPRVYFLKLKSKFHYKSS